MDMKRIGCIVALALLAGSAFAQSSEDEARRRLVDAAFKYRGVPYVYGAESPRAFDCSGFVRYVYREALGLELPRSARSFWSSGSPIDWRKARAGDVLVYDTVGGAPSHVALVVGDGTVIHAVSAGTKTGVIVSPMSDRYWAPRLLGARSFIVASTETVSAAPVAPASPRLRRPRRRQRR
ncbi:MAG TPA: C40 family peptidase [Spirochaetales bacterium]|nr:C40 family peptidase [Spirochaetales bacterium]